jgi:hypothetical protein
MWNCRSCGCQAIASDLMACPHCGLPRRETSMARISVGEGASNAADPDVVEETPPAKSAPKDEHVDYAVRVLGLSQEDAEGLTKADLIDLEHADDDEEGSSSAGTSSSASESKQDKSGSTPQETGQSTRPPASSAGSHSGGHQQSSQGSPSTARSTGGHTRGTGPSQPGQQSSSGATSPGDEQLTKGRGGRQ